MELADLPTRCRSNAGTDVSCAVAGPLPPPHGFIEFCLAMTDAALMRDQQDGEKLSFEMSVILAHIIFDGYELFPGGKRPCARSETDL
jgi:hypothetical protein